MATAIRLKCRPVMMMNGMNIVSRVGAKGPRVLNIMVRTLPIKIDSLAPIGPTIASPTGSMISISINGTNTNLNAFGTHLLRYFSSTPIMATHRMIGKIVLEYVAG